MSDAQFADTVDMHPLKTIRNGVRVYGVFLLAGWVGFEVLRRRLTSAYYCRDRKPETRTPVTDKTHTNKVLGWVWPLLTTKDEDVLDASGLDALFFLRFIRMCEKVAFFAIGLSIIFAPVYYYGSPHAQGAEKKNQEDVIYRMSMSNVQEGETQQWRLGVTTVAMYLLSGWTLYLLLKEFTEYTRRRHEFMSKKATQQYTVLVNGLPEHLRTQQTLRNYMEALFPKNVLHVYVAVECRDLEKFVAERVKVRDRLENALAKTAKTGERMMTRTKFLGPQRDAIEMYQKQLERLNKAVEMEVRSILRNQEALADRMADLDHLQALEGEIPTLQSPATLPSVEPLEEEPTFQDDFLEAIKKAGGGFRNTGIMRATGFVTFNTLRAAQSAQQVLQSANPTEILIEPAPNVDDIVWKNIGVSANQKSSWKLISLAATVGIILFWTIPTSFVVTLASVDSLTKIFHGFRQFSEKHTWVNPFLQQLSPLLLSMMGALAPIIFRNLSRREGHTAGAAVENSLLNKLVAYQCYIVFLFPILGNTILSTISGNTDQDAYNVKALTDKVGKAIPIQSSFFITYLMVQMGLPTSLELLRVKPIAMASIYNVFAPKLTPRQRSSPWLFFAPLSVPGDFSPTDAIGQMFLVLILTLTFATISPIMSYFCALYLVLCDLLYRWNVLCVSDPSPHTSALFFPSLYRFCIGALLFAQIILLVNLGLKKAPAAATCAIFMPFLTIGFHTFVWGRFNRASVNLPLDQCVIIDSRRHRHLDDLETILEDVYKQPAMAERAPIVPDYAALASDPNDAHSLVSPVHEEQGYC